MCLCLDQIILYTTQKHELTVCFFQLDVLVHRLVTLLADIGDSKSTESRVSDANLACRKMAVSHPVLLLR